MPLGPSSFVFRFVTRELHRKAYRIASIIIYSISLAVGSVYLFLMALKNNISVISFVLLSERCYQGKAQLRAHVCMYMHAGDRKSTCTQKSWGRYRFRRWIFILNSNWRMGLGRLSVAVFGIDVDVFSWSRGITFFSTHVCS